MKHESIADFRARVFNAATQKELLRILFEQTKKDGNFSNMEDNDKKKFNQLREKIG